MKRIDMGLSSVEITGNREEEAAKFYEERLALIEHLASQPGTYYSDMVDSLWADVQNEFGVELHVV